MTLTRSCKPRGNQRTIQPLLSAIGLPKKMIYPIRNRWGRNHAPVFWERGEGYLLSMLEGARNRYRQSIKTAHPDRFGSHKEAAELNRTWSRIKLLFSRRGLTLP